MTLGGAAQHMQTEGVRVRDQQEKALKRFEGTNAIATLSQLVGTLLLFYLPTVAIFLYETFTVRPANPLLLKATQMCLMLAPAANCFMYGIKNKAIQMTLINFARKEFYKNEVQQEIRLRSPGVGGSARPSVTSIVGQITCQVPYLQRQVSEVSLVPVSFQYLISTKNTPAVALQRWWLIEKKQDGRIKCPIAADGAFHASDWLFTLKPQ
jgi:hypothetical protein